MDKLLETLKSLSEDDLNQILDMRDTADFDSEWNRAFSAMKTLDLLPNEENVFLQLSNATNHHEICSYIADDLSLLFTAEKRNISSSFLNYIEQSYKQGVIPCKWSNQ